MEKDNILEELKKLGFTCKSCWWQEGGRCYKKGVERIPNPEGWGSISTKMADEICEEHTSKRSVLEKVIPANILKIASEEKDKSIGGDGIHY